MNQTTLYQQDEHQQAESLTGDKESSTEHKESSTEDKSSTGPNEASVAAAAKAQLDELKADAEKMLADLKEQEQLKLKQALARVKAEKAIDNEQNYNKAQAQSAERKAKAEQADFVQRVDEEQKQAQKKAADEQLAKAKKAGSGTSLDELILEGSLLHPLKGLEKIQGIHGAQLDALLEQISATIETTEPEQQR